MPNIYQAIDSGELDENLLFHIDEANKMRTSYGAENEPSLVLDMLWARLDVITRPNLRK